MVGVNIVCGFGGVNITFFILLANKYVLSKDIKIAKILTNATNFPFRG